MQGGVGGGSGSPKAPRAGGGVTAEQLLCRPGLALASHQDWEHAENLNLRVLDLDFLFLCLGSGMGSSATCLAGTATPSNTIKQRHQATPPSKAIRLAGQRTT